MKTLKDHVVLFDGECPMCRTYTLAFVKTGMLDTDGRVDYQNGMDVVCPVIDKQRAVDEIALVDLKSGEVTYGIKSLFKILANACPVFGPLFSFRPFAWLMSKVYAFISYNRRVIIPAPESSDGYVYQPSFKLHYRLAYLLLTWFCTGYILTAYTHFLAGVIPLGGAYREYLICGGQMIFQGIIIIAFAREKLWAYLGNMMTISFAGSLLLLVPVVLSNWIKFSLIFYPEYFMATAGLMFLEHIRRTKLLELGWILTFTWVLYRVLLLGLIVIVD